MQLKPRLKLIADKVPPCVTVCDVGTDHAYIPIYLVANDICSKGIASDVVQGPVMAARENIDRFGLEGLVEARQGYGLDTLQVGEADAIVIAGMGGQLIAEILERGMDRARSVNTLVLQPMNGMELLRKWLYEKGFDIFDEEMTAEGDKIYVVISARWTGQERIHDEVYYHIGEKLVERRDPLLGRFIDNRFKTLEKAVNEIQNSRNPDIGVEQRYRRLIKGFKDIKSRLES